MNLSMAEEYQESEVIFQENVGDDQDYDTYSNSRGLRNNNKIKRQKKKKNSVPVNVPENLSRNSWFSDLFDHDDDGGITPPHVILGRRIAAGKMAFSVCTGNGRTLKGRDLSQVRNSILRMTGFLETTNMNSWF